MGSAPTEHATAEWLESTGGNEKLVAIQLEPRAPFDAEQTRRARGEGRWERRGGRGDGKGERGRRRPAEEEEKNYIEDKIATIS